MTKKLNLSKFLVVSYDSDEQQWFYDIVFATSADEAKNRIMKLRPYVIDADVSDHSQMEKLGRAFAQETREKSEAWLAEML